MQVIRGQHNLQKYSKTFTKGCVATIGNYDGIHLGHQQILQQLQAAAKNQNLPSVVITFYPQPREFFTKDHKPRRLMNLREKLAKLREYDINYVLCIYFNKELSSLSATDFVQKIKVSKLNIKQLLIGYDFALGNKRIGNIDFLQKCGAENSFKLTTIPQITLDGERISSTIIREALLKGNLETAEKFLGRPYGVCGKIIHGDKLGRELDFPTANIHLHKKVVPLSGVYAVRAYIAPNTLLSGIANVGFRPTTDKNKRLLEIYLFNFRKNIYGKLVRVNFLYKVRDEQHFANFSELKNQISCDVAKVKKDLRKKIHRIR